MESRELASGKVVNDIFLGLELGMTQKSFYETCWDLNKEGILTNGPTELSVEYKADMPSGNKASMRFFPKFNEKKIYLMPVEFTYEAYAPWNEEMNSDRLLDDVKVLFEEWYGEGFIEVTDEDETKRVWVKVDGNRRIRIFKKHISVVRAEIVDLPLYKNIQSEKPS
ncbi:hypothetical protein [Algoriphagus sediminis]|uniref:Uncharacterized protein n=1 Tax=Algoriphagus sediminis TaxID=3057113 RepID=A0ABT7YFX7_9BACT|nr:hypothetical protein [Algoriphagus sediminis]MDN3205376.1 hypothetical protein [Algoriphagus sediminis]